MDLASFPAPAALILLAGGGVAGFAGYAVLRPLLAIYGCIGGIVLTPAFVDLDGWRLVAAAIGGGAAGAAAAMTAYLAAVAVIGAGAAAFLVHVVIDGDPVAWMVIAACVVGALLALLARRGVIIIGTAFAGGWTALAGGMALARHEAAAAAVAGDVARLFPLAPLDGQEAFAAGWIALGLAGSVVQWVASTASAPRGAAAGPAV